MGKTIFNQEAVICIEVGDFSKCGFLHYEHDRRRKWWNPNNGAGWYTSYMMQDKRNTEPYTQAELLSGKWHGTKITIKFDGAYYNPFVRFIYVGKRNTSIQFDSYDEALSFANEQKNKTINATFEASATNKYFTP